jgi:CRP-like cAMP-binding protein
LAEVILRHCMSRSVLPRIAQVVQGLSLFAGLSGEQIARLAGACTVSTFAPGEVIFEEGQASQEMQVVLQGEVAISVAGSGVAVGAVRPGECLGEMYLLNRARHSATATARTRVETVVLGHQDLTELIRFRPDIGLHIYKNLAIDIGEKLKRSGASLACRQ